MRTARHKVVVIVVPLVQCAMPNVGFKSKWFFMEALPLAAMALFLTFHVAQVVKKRFIFGRRRNLNSHVASLVGTTLVMMYASQAPGVEASPVIS
jgi:hypothetical protein